MGEGVARPINIDVTKSELRSEADINQAVDGFARESNGGLIVLPNPLTALHRRLIIAAAARDRLPAIYPFRGFSENGGLMVYGSDGRDIFRRAVAYVDRILQGENPANLPIQQPNKFEMIINLKTAKALGLAIPNHLSCAPTR